MHVVTGDTLRCTVACAYLAVYLIAVHVLSCEYICALLTPSHQLGNRHRRELKSSLHITHDVAIYEVRSNVVLIHALELDERTIHIIEKKALVRPLASRDVEVRLFGKGALEGVTVYHRKRIWRITRSPTRKRNAVSYVIGNTDAKRAVRVVQCPARAHNVHKLFWNVVQAHAYREEA